MTTKIELDFDKLDRELSKTKTKVFLGKSAGFYGSIMSSLNFMWMEDIATAQTNGIHLGWNPRFFLKLVPEVRITVLTHELMHLAYLDMLRRGNRDPKMWNRACDIWINNNLKKEGYSFAGTKPWLHMPYDGKSKEEIYDLLLLWPKEDMIIFQGMGPWGVDDDNGDHDEGDLIEPEDTMEERMITSTVINAANVAQMAGDMPDELETMLKRFLSPKIAWNEELYMFMQDLGDYKYSYRRPNRRYQPLHMFLPSIDEDEGRLDAINYYVDVSGSTSDGMVIRMNSEVKYIKEYFNPRKLNLILFDDKIQKEIIFKEEDEFDQVIIMGRGGTSLDIVREHILEHTPDAAIIFSDMGFTDYEASTMEPVDTPIIWVAVNAPDAKVSCGKLIHIRE